MRLLPDIIILLSILGIILIIFYRGIKEDHLYTLQCDSGYIVSGLDYVVITKGVVRYKEGSIRKERKMLHGETCWEIREEE